MENNAIKQADADYSEGIKINPVFDDLSDPATFIDHLSRLKFMATNGQNYFPIEVFPEPIQDIISDTNVSLKFPIDYIGASLLYAVSVAVANTHHAELKKGWRENAVLYLAIVGRRGVTKSHPLSWALQPFNDSDKLKHKEYKERMKEYQRISEMTTKERKDQELELPEKPVWEQYLVTDFTPEALADAHKYNPRGIGVYADELAGWFNNFNRYNKGSEEQFWLSVWSGKPIRINRKTTEPTYLPLPFISVVGTIQPALLNELANNRKENGFTDRILFVLPENLKKESWSENELRPETVTSWQNVLSNLLKLELQKDETDNPNPTILRFTPDAKKILFDWQRDMTDKINQLDNDLISGIFAKFETYVIRLALCLEMMLYACEESDKKTIGVRAVNGAIRLIEYFENTAMKVHSILSDADPLDLLPKDKQMLYAALPESFTTGEGVQIAHSMNIPERTLKRFLTESELFTRVKTGIYEKLL